MGLVGDRKTPDLQAVQVGVRPDLWGSPWPDGGDLAHMQASRPRRCLPSQLAEALSSLPAGWAGPHTAPLSTLRIQ